MPGAARHDFAVLHAAASAVAEVRWNLLGEHNVMNALAAIAAARQSGVAPQRAAAALRRNFAA